MNTLSVRIRSLAFLLVAASVSALAQARIPAYHTYYNFLLASPGAMRFGMDGYDNPAILPYIRYPELSFGWTNAPAGTAVHDRWGFVAAGPHSSFGMIKQYSDAGSLADYRMSFGFGNRSFGLGAGFLWSSGERAAFQRANMFTLGALIRPGPDFSFGLIGTTTYDGRAHEGVIDVALRPLATGAVTLFADYAIQQDQSLNDGNWSTGAVVEPWDGVRLSGRYLSVSNTNGFTVGLQFSFGYAGFTAQHHENREGNPSYQTYGVRLGGYDRNIFSSTVLKNSSYYEAELTGRLDYRSFWFFDSRRPLLDLLNSIDAASSDPRVRGIVINTSGLSASGEMLWELREKLRSFKEDGKRVVVYLDRANMNLYHLASVADLIVMDPLGMLTLDGYVLGRTYFKGTLEKLGIGFEEWRYFKYKSANETFARDSFSDADREQFQELANDFYTLARDGVAHSGRITAAGFDKLVDTKPVLMAREAIAAGLVDTLVRWDAIAGVLARNDGSPPIMLSAGLLEAAQLPYDNHWGQPKQIAVIYALGVCDMDAGIAARRLVHDVDRAVSSDQIKAIVLRVDSPGGDALASDYIAEALRKAKGKKPVIVSQGAVAGSGGYWLSMYGDTIVAAPNTITGSIGVIGGWFYDKGLKSSLGISTDFVKAGKHADLGFGFSLPLIGTVLPDRNLSDEERARTEQIIRSMYQEFVEKVATGRKMDPASVDSIGQGHIFSGVDGSQNGLVDILGGLDTAIRIAKERSGIPPQEYVDIVEMPAVGWFNLSALMPLVAGVESPPKPDPFVEYLMFRVDHNGIPMPLLPLEDAYLHTERP
jgi:protease IV